MAAEIATGWLSVLLNVLNEFKLLQRRALEWPRLALMEESR